MATDAIAARAAPTTYVIERLMDVIADDLALDRLRLRLKNFPEAQSFRSTLPPPIL